MPTKRKTIPSKNGGSKTAPKSRIAAQQDVSPSTAGRRRFIQKAGFQYGSKRDIYATAGYIRHGEETFDHYWSLYDRGGLAGKIVDMKPQTTWKTPPGIVEEGVEGSKFVEQLTALANRTKLWHYLQRVDRLSRIGEYGILLIGTAGVTETDLKNDLSRMKKPEDVLYFSAYSQGDATIAEWEKDVANPRFGFPTLYDLKLTSGVDSFKATMSDTVKVHHSRIIHVAEDLITDEVHGRPALKRCLNILADLEKVCAATGEAYWQLATRILIGNIDAEAEVPPATLTALGESTEEMIHDLRRQLVVQGVDYKWLESVPPDPTGAGDFFLALLAAASGYPARILLGSERGELASSQDERNYMGSINERQEQHAEPNILRALIDRLIERGALTPPKNGYTVIWPELFEMSEAEKAIVSKTRAETAKTLTAIGDDPTDLVEIASDGTVTLRESGERGPVDLEEEDDDGEGGEPPLGVSLDAEEDDEEDDE